MRTLSLTEQEWCALQLLIKSVNDEFDKESHASGSFTVRPTVRLNIIEQQYVRNITKKLQSRNGGLPLQCPPEKPTFSIIEFAKSTGHVLQEWQLRWINEVWTKNPGVPFGEIIPPKRVGRNQLLELVISYKKYLLAQRDRFQTPDQIRANSIPPNNS